MAPLYRDGDVVIVSPAAPVRRGDRVVVKTTAGEIMAKELKRETARTIELRSVNPAYSRPHDSARRGQLDGPHSLGEPDDV